MSLSEKQYEAVGRLTLAFNEIEYVFETYIAHFLNAPIWGVNVLLAGEGRFWQKAQRFDNILAVLQKEQPLLHSQLQDVRVLVARSKDLAKKRNDHVHALVVHDFGKNSTHIRIRGKLTFFKWREVNGLAAEAIILADQVGKLCEELLVMIGITEQEKHPGSP